MIYCFLHGIFRKKKSEKNLPTFNFFDELSIEDKKT